MQEATILDEDIVCEIQKMAKDWMQRIINKIASAENNKKKQREEDSELDIDEELMMVGLEMFENNF